jgi:uncharacterized protein with HEPN domain
VKEDRIYLEHIRDCLNWIAEYTADGKTTFFADRKTQDAVIRNLEVIGEAAKQLSAEARAAQPSVPWKQIAGMRDVLIRHYFGVDLSIVWEVVEQHVPPLRRAVDQLLAQN